LVQLDKMLTQLSGILFRVGNLGKTNNAARGSPLVRAREHVLTTQDNMQAITSTFTVKPVTRRLKTAKRGSLQVVAHGGVGGSGGPQYAGKDPAYGSDKAAWKKKLILHDDDQADPDANQRSGARWTPPPPAQESFAAAAPAQSTSSWDTPSSGGGGSGASNAYSWDSGGSGSAAAKPQRVTRASDGVTYDPDQYDPDANQRRGGGGGGGGYSAPAAPAPSYGGSSFGGSTAAKPQRVVRAPDGVTYDPDQYDPDANQRSR